MNKPWTALLLVCFASSVFAGPESIIKQRAKDLRDQNNARQGVQPAQPQPAPAVRTPALAQPQVMAPATPQQAASARLQSDMNAIKSGRPVTQDQKDNLARSMVGAVNGPNKLSLTTADKAANSLAAALNEKLLTNALRNRVLQNVQGLLTGHNMGAEQTQATIADVQKSLEGAGVSSAAAASVASDLKLVAAEIQKPARK